VIPALKTGNLKVITNAVVREILTGSDGQASGVSYILKDDMQEYQVNAKTVILAASTCESARILLNSKSAQHPNGLANSSNAVGKYLHDSTQGGGAVMLPQLMNRKRFNEDGVGSLHLYAPWWLDNKKLDFARGYHLEIFGGMMMPGYGGYLGFEGSLVPVLNGYLPGADGKMKPGGGYGLSLKDDYRRFYGTLAGFGCHGASTAREDNYCEIDPNVVDKYGIPVLRFRYKWSQDDVNQAKHMAQTSAEILKGMGGIPLMGPATAENNYGLDKPGKGIHEVGTVRMGDDPKRAPLNKWGQAHDCKNLFVTDGSVFTQQSEKNPTWTILALSMRTAEYLIDQRKKQNV
jgi:choline dehydrogenase-like flavoprotein